MSADKHVYCHECADVTSYDSDGLCSKCGSDNTLSYEGKMDLKRKIELCAEAAHEIEVSGE